jgi:subtilisin family serine protease
MRRLASAVMVVIAMVAGASQPAHAQVAPPPKRVVVPPPTRIGLTPLGWYAAGAIGCVAVSPMIATIVLGRELTEVEGQRMALNCVIGPLAWLLGPELFPDKVATNTPPRHPVRRQVTRQKTQRVGGRHIDIPPPGETRFVRNEVLLAFSPAASAQYIGNLARALQLTLLETQNFALTDTSVRRFRIDGNRSVRNTLRLVQGRYALASVGQANLLYAFGPPETPQQADTGAQYVVPKLHLLEAHKITNGDDVLVAVIDSKIDTQHPELAGVIADQYDAIGGPAPAHLHGTGMAGAIAAHAKLVGVAPKVKLLAVHAFTGGKETAQATTFNVLKGLDWAAGKHARVVNMSFAGPPDLMLHDMLAKAHACGIVLIAAVGNAGPRSPPLYPAADPEVIGVTATDADDKLLPQAVRGSQVAVAAPGVQVLEPAPDAAYQITTGTSVAAAHVSGVAALLLARNPKLTPDEVRELLIKSARAIPGKKRDIGAGVIDALGAVASIN